MDQVVTFLDQRDPLLLAGVAGLLTAVLAWGLTRLAQRSCDLPARSWGLVAAVAGGLLGTGLVVALLVFLTQQTPEVRPDRLWAYGRVAYQLVLLACLIAVTCTDLQDYMVPDSITLPSLLFGVIVATIAGDLQMAHVWVDWNAEVPQFWGPYIPAWVGTHPHWHGLAYSLAGAAMGAGLTWMVRILSRLLLGTAALGFGDVTLMAMAGSYLGWQPTVVAFLIAPLLAIGVGIVWALIGRSSYLPYGPFLSMAVVVVMFVWRSIWQFELSLVQNDRPGRGEVFSVRRLFGDPISLGILLAILVGGMILLLGLLRLYRALPGRRAD